MTALLSHVTVTCNASLMDARPTNTFHWMSPFQDRGIWSFFDVRIEACSDHRPNWNGLVMWKHRVPVSLITDTGI